MCVEGQTSVAATDMQTFVRAQIVASHKCPDICIVRVRACVRACMRAHSLVQTCEV